MGVVYKALDTKLERAVALKFLPARLLCDTDARARFEREAKAASALNHPNITIIHEMDDVDEHRFIVMEYVEGKTIRQLASEGSIALDEILSISIEICRGLDAAHRKGIVHRDVKSDNIKVSPDGTVKIMDFGLAKLRDATRLTRSGTTLGTLPYMSPEQVSGKEVDQRSDLFSLGVVLYELVTGRLPFMGEYDQAVIHSILNDTPEPLARYKADVPDGLQRIVAKALAKNPDERYQHADGLLADLKHEKRVSGQPVAATAPREVRTRKSISRLRRLVGLAAIVAAIAVFCAVFEPFRVEMGPGEEATAQENSLAVMYFENMVDPADTDRTAQMITTLLITDLSESDYMYVISRQRLYDILKLLRKEDLKVIDRTVASDVAERAGVKWILTGSILQVEPSIVLTSDISEASSGKILATQRITGKADEDLFAVVDRLSAAVKQDLELPEAARSEPDRPVAEVTTHSPEAYRYFVEGVENEDRYYTPEAKESYRKAIEADSTFAMAYYRLARLNPGLEGQAFSEKAMDHAVRASERERYLIRSFWTSYQNDPAGAIEILKEAARKYPDDKEIRYEMAMIYSNEMDRVNDAIEQLMKAVEIDPMFTMAYNDLAYRYSFVGDFERSIWAINKYIALAPQDPNPYDSRGDLYAYNGKVEDAIASYEEAVRIKPDFRHSLRKLGHMHLFEGEYDVAEHYYRQNAASPPSETRSWARLNLALIPAHQGHFEDALRVIDDGLAADRMDGYNKLYTAEKHMLKGEIHLFRHEYEQSAEELRIFIDIAHGFNPYAVFYCHPLLVLALAKGGKMEEAEQVIGQIESDVLAGSEKDRKWLLRARALLAYAAGDASSTIASLEEARRIDPLLPLHIQTILAESYMKVGRLSDAVSELEQALLSYDDNRVVTPTYSVRAHYLAGVAYEESGWDDKAAEQYERFLEIWKGADPGIAEIEAARKRVAKLKGKS